MTLYMKRLALCVDNVVDYLQHGSQYSLVMINPKMDPVMKQRIISRAGCDAVIDQDGFRYIGNGTEHQDEAMVFTTSGSTGEVKLCAFTQSQIEIKIRQLCDWFELSSNDRYISMIPLWTAYAMSFYLAARRVGMQIDFVDTKNIRKIPDYNPTVLLGTPRLLQILPKSKMPALRFIRSAAETLTSTQYHQFTEMFGTKILNSYGMTEAFGTCLHAPLHEEQPSGVELRPFGMEARITNGELELKGPTFFRPGWHATGDLAYQDSRGFYIIQGRIKDLISINGTKIVPSMVENMLLERHPEIEDVVIFGEDSINVIYEGKCDGDSLMKDIRSLCFGYRPALVQRVDTIPTTAAGKVSRSNLAQVFNAN
jgi:acyl-coenzyme A synthetase/AMP-(fatty) acid ligase